MTLNVCAACTMRLFARSVQLGRREPSRHALTALRASYTPIERRRYADTETSRAASSVDTPPHKNAEISSSRLVNEVRNRAAGFTETYVAYGVTDALYKECARQANYAIFREKDEKGNEIKPPQTGDGVETGIGEGWWYDELKLTPTFNTWAQITILHLYILATRFRMFTPEHAPSWQQHLLDHFFYDSEHRMTEYHKMDIGGVRQRYLKDLFVQYRGALAAYDEGLCQTDAVLASALWRNIFGGSTDVDATGLAQVVAYVRRNVHTLQRLPDEELAAGRWKFTDPLQEKQLLREKSSLVDEPFREEDLQKPKEES